MEKRLFLAIPLLLLGSSAMAQTVSESEALEKAMNFVKSHGPQYARGNEASVQLTLAHKASAQDETYYYVFNNVADGGFVIIGGDEVAEEVLGYSENGTFDYDQLPANFRWWLSTYEQSIGRSIRAQRANPDVAANTPKRAKASFPAIPHLIKTQWNQDMPYNAMIPGNTYATPYGEQYATGCVATAVAQIMKFHEWPNHGWSRKSYKANGFTYEANFGNTVYDWNKMQNSYSDTYTGSLEEKEVAQLMYHVGVAVDMDYGTMNNGGSGASTYTAAQRLVTYFGYKSGQYIERNEVSDNDWETYIYSELNDRRPVLYSGRDVEGGHAFICDGYEDSKYHINWGWGGYCDGVYNLTPTSTEDALDPNGSGIGGAGEGSTYKKNQSIVVGLEPDRTYDGGLNVLEVIMPHGGYYTKDEEFEIEFVLDNSSSVTRTISAPTLYVYSGNGSEYYGYLDGQPDFNVDPYSTKTLTISSNGSVPYWMEQAQSLILLLVDYSDNYRYNQLNVEVVHPLDINYTLTDAEWGTICLPYDAEIPEGLTAYEVTRVNSNGTLVRSEATKLEMNKAYLLNGTAGTYPFHGPDTPQGVYKNGVLTGVTRKTGVTAPLNSYVLQNQPTNGVAFYKVTGDSYNVKKYSAYLMTDAPMGARILIDEETGIQRVALDEAESNEMLNVMGQRTNATKGLVIVNGKLNFVK